MTQRVYVGSRIPALRGSIADVKPSVNPGKVLARFGADVLDFDAGSQFYEYDAEEFGQEPMQPQSHEVISADTHPRETIIEAADRAHQLTLPDTIDHPQHYGGADNPYEAIKVIEAWELGFALGNTIKYIARHGKKGSAVEDLKKARWYLDWEIKQLEKQR